MIRTRVLKFARRVDDGLHRVAARLPGRLECCYCGRSLTAFLPYRKGWASVSGFVRDLRPVGSDPQNHLCPHCGSHDRERHLFYYFDALGLWKDVKGQRVLHFAPERLFSRAIQSHGPSSYERADLNPTVPGVLAMDVTRIPNTGRQLPHGRLQPRSGACPR